MWAKHKVRGHPCSRRRSHLSLSDNRGCPRPRVLWYDERHIARQILISDGFVTEFELSDSQCVCKAPTVALSVEPNEGVELRTCGCPAGSYRSNSGDCAACIPCPPGTFSSRATNAHSADVCSPCPPTGETAPHCLFVPVTQHM